MLFLVEISSSGAVSPSTQFSYLSQSELNKDLIPKDSRNADYVGLLIFIMVIGFLLLEIREMIGGIKTYLTDFWNYTDIIFFLAIFIVYCLRFRLPGAVDPNGPDTSSVYIISLVNFVTARRTLYSFLVMWAFIRIMLYGRLIKTTGTLIVAMKEMIRNDVFNFLILLVIILIGWSYMLTQLLKSYVPDYRNVGVSITTLFKSVLGGVEFVTDTGNVVQETVANILLGIFALVALVLLVNLLIAMMGNTYDQIQEAAVQNWSYSKAQSLIYFEKSHWIPPFNIFSEAVRLVLWVSNTLTCGLVSKTTGVSDDYGLDKIGSVFGKLKPDEEETSPKFSQEIIKRIIFPEDDNLVWGTNIMEESIMDEEEENSEDD